MHEDERGNEQCKYALPCETRILYEIRANVQHVHLMRHKIIVRAPSRDQERLLIVRAGTRTEEERKHIIAWQSKLDSYNSDVCSS